MFPEVTGKAHKACLVVAPPFSGEGHPMPCKVQWGAVKQLLYCPLTA